MPVDFQFMSAITKDSPVTAIGRRGRVLCVTSNFPRWQGDSTTPFVLNLAEDLQTIGWHIDVLAPHAPGAAIQETMRGVNVRRFRYMWPSRGQTLCYGGGALINLRKHPFRLLQVPAFLALQTSAIRAALKTNAYDLIHSHWILPQGFSAMLARSKQNIPNVVTVHGGDIFALQGKLMGRLKARVLNSCEAVTANSSVTESAVRAVVSSRNRIERIPMGVTTDGWHDQTKALARQLRTQHRGEDGLLIFAGRLVEEKGIGDLLMALQILRREGVAVRLVAVGEGQERMRFERLAAALDLQNAVDFVGWVDPAMIYAYIGAGDVFLGPSKRAENGWVEAQGLTFLEAMVVGTPVVATRNGGIVDAVIDGQTGLLVDEDRPDQIAIAIKRLLGDDNLRERLVANAGASIENRFSREVSSRAFSELFQELIASTKTPKCESSTREVKHH